ncbi:MAG: WD40 repeat domain-containing protein [Armatimonadota bacterium]|nr:WD40 repeat domain-containing protein [Armatimonadota bacterium]
MFLLPLSASAQALKSAPYAQATTLGTLQDPAINESSGVAASRRNPGLFWTHNDSGDGPFVYALGPHGEKRGTFRLRGVSSVTDCEDIAIGPGPQPGVPYLYLGDIGDNAHNRSQCVVWRFPEPHVTKTETHTTQAHPVLTDAPEALRFVYPDGPHDAETLLVHPKTGRVYVVTKNKSGVNGVYTFPMPLNAGKTVTLARVGTVKITGEPPMYPNLVTGGDIAPDGRRVVLRTYWSAYEYMLPTGKSSFDAVWKTMPALIALPLQAQGEGICYTWPKGDALVLTSEGKGTTLYELRRK